MSGNAARVGESIETEQPVLEISMVPPFVGDMVSGEPYVVVYTCPRCSQSFEIICGGVSLYTCARCLDDDFRVMMTTTVSELEYDDG